MAHNRIRNHARYQQAECRDVRRPHAGGNQALFAVKDAAPSPGQAVADAGNVAPSQMITALLMRPPRAGWFPRPARRSRIAPSIRIRATVRFMHCPCRAMSTC